MSISPNSYRQGREVTASSDIRRKRLLFRSWHRGTRESDLILGRFAESHLAALDEERLDRYEALLECADADIFDWVSGRAAPPPEHDHDVTRLLLSFSNAYPHPPSPAGLVPLSRIAGEGADPRIAVRGEAGEGTPTL
jgi:antitoxin CptB